VKVRVVGFGNPSPGSEPYPVAGMLSVPLSWLKTIKTTFSLSFGRLVSFTEKVAAVPSSPVSNPEVGVTTIPAESLSILNKVMLSGGQVEHAPVSKWSSVVSVSLSVKKIW
jgi:hypothetical protein